MISDRQTTDCSKRADEHADFSFLRVFGCEAPTKVISKNLTIQITALQRLQSFTIHWSIGKIGLSDTTVWRTFLPKFLYPILNSYRKPATQNNYVWRFTISSSH